MQLPVTELKFWHNYGNNCLMYMYIHHPLYLSASPLSAMPPPPSPANPSHHQPHPLPHLHLWHWLEPHELHAGPGVHQHQLLVDVVGHSAGQPARRGEPR